MVKRRVAVAVSVTGQAYMMNGGLRHN